MAHPQHLTISPSFTVRLPGARMAPTARTSTCGQTRLLKIGANAENRVSYLLGRVCIGQPLGKAIWP